MKKQNPFISLDVFGVFDKVKAEIYCADGYKVDSEKLHDPLNACVPACGKDKNGNQMSFKAKVDPLTRSTSTMGNPGSEMYHEHHCISCERPYGRYSEERQRCVDEHGCTEDEAHFRLKNGDVACVKACNDWQEFDAYTGTCFYVESKVCEICDQVKSRIQGYPHSLGTLSAAPFKNCPIENFTQELNAYLDQGFRDLNKASRTCSDWVWRVNDILAQHDPLAADTPELIGTQISDSPCMSASSRLILTDYLENSSTCRIDYEGKQMLERIFPPINELFKY
jgi:hypothetical protein